MFPNKCPEIDLAPSENAGDLDRCETDVKLPSRDWIQQIRKRDRSPRKIEITIANALILRGESAGVRTLDLLIKSQITCLYYQSLT
jgi:hypothetical protein